MTLDGLGPYQISKEFAKDKIPCPAYHMQQMGIGLWKTREIKHPYTWNSSTIANILTKKEYLGHTVNSKTRKHFKDKKATMCHRSIGRYLRTLRSR